MENNIVSESRKSEVFCSCFLGFFFFQLCFCFLKQLAGNSFREVCNTGISRM